MNFSDCFQSTRHLAGYSPDGKYLASCSQHRLVVRDAWSLQILHLHTCLDPIQYFEWSPDSSLIMTAMYKRSLIQIWSVEEPEWTCKIDEGSAGLVGCRWSSDSRHVLTVADFHLRLTLWSLSTKSVSYIKYPKLVQDGTDFSPDGRHMVLAERRNCKDYLSIFSTDNWKLLRHFPVETRDLNGLSWSPNGDMICVWDASITYHLYVYSMDGTCISSYTAYSDEWQFGLGIRCVRWSPTGQFLAVGSYDGKVRLLNHITWKVISEYDHTPVIDDGRVAIYKEVEQKAGPVDPSLLSTLGKTVFPVSSRYETQEVPFILHSVKPDHSKPNPKMGVRNISFSANGRYMCTYSEATPTTVWIWDIPRVSLVAVLTHGHPVRDTRWDPTADRLALCTNTGRLYLWSLDGCVSVVVSCDHPPISVQRIQWHPSGQAIGLIGPNQFCVCFMNNK